MVTDQTLRRTIAAGVAAVLMVLGVALPAGAADAATRSPWDGIARCESGGNWSIDTGNGYYGGLQFSASTWAAHGGRGSAARASRAEQIEVGRRVVVAQGWEAWSSCSARLGLRGRSLAADPDADQRRSGNGRHARRTASTGVAACTAKTLKARFVDGGSTAGTRHADLVLTNTGAHRCRLDRAPRAVYFSAHGHDGRVGATGVHDRKAGRLMAAASTRSPLVLRAHGGHAYSRISVAAADDDGSCRPVDVAALVTILRGSPHAIRASLRGRPLQTCDDSDHKTLSFEQYRPKRSTGRR